MDQCAMRDDEHARFMLFVIETEHGISTSVPPPDRAGHGFVFTLCSRCDAEVLPGGDRPRGGSPLLRSREWVSLKIHNVGGVSKHFRARIRACTPQSRDQVSVTGPPRIRGF